MQAALCVKLQYDAHAALQQTSTNQHQRMSQNGERWRRVASLRTAIVALAALAALMLLQLTPLGAQIMADHGLRAAAVCHMLFGSSTGRTRAFKPSCDASNCAGQAPRGDADHHWHASSPQAPCSARCTSRAATRSRDGACGSSGCRSSRRAQALLWQQAHRPSCSSWGMCGIKWGCTRAAAHTSLWLRPQKQVGTCLPARGRACSPLTSVSSMCH